MSWRWVPLILCVRVILANEKLYRNNILLREKNFYKTINHFFNFRSNLFLLIEHCTRIKFKELIFLVVFIKKARVFSAFNIYLGQISVTIQGQFVTYIAQENCHNLITLRHFKALLYDRKKELFSLTQPLKGRLRQFH